VTQTIRRAARRHRFVIVDQAAVEDTRLSWAARGLLAYLLSWPDDWKVLVNDLKKRGGTYIVSEVPAPCPEKPDADSPDMASPRPVQPGALPNTDGHQRTTTTNRPTDTDRGINVNRHTQPLHFPDWVPQEIQRSPLGYLKTLATRCRAGDMSGNPNNRATFGPIFRVTRE
jgi:hypothetical protein